MFDRVPGRNKTQKFEQIKAAAAKARAPFDKDVLLNLAFFLDQQYVEWVADANMIRQIPRKANEENMPRPVANKITHFVVQQHASALRDKPTVDVLPATEDPGDINIASVSLAYLKYLSEPQVADFDGELSNATWWALFGEGYLKWTYNELQNRPDVMSVSPLDLYTDPYAVQFKNARYLIHSQFMDVEQVEEIYGKKVQKEDMSKADVEKAALLREMGQASVLDGAAVNELWVRPTKRNPKGLFVVWAGKDFLVEPQQFPYAHGRLPFTQLGAIPRPGAPHFTSSVKYLRSPQMELNKYHAQRLMVREKFSNPKWWIPTDLELEADPNDSTGQILRGHSQGGTLKPEIIQPTTFPENTDGDWIREEMRDVAGQHEVSHGQVPGRVEAARAIAQLKDIDDEHLHELHRTMKLSISEGFWQMLMLTKQYVSDDVIVQTYSKEGLPEVKKFKSADIKPGMRVSVTMDTGLARNRTARQDQAMMMWEKGIIRDPEVMAELMQIPVGNLTPQRVYDVRLARNENLTMASGKDQDGRDGTAVTPNSWDEHDIHLREHNNFRKTAEYEQLPSEIKKKFEYHCKTHETMELEKLQKEAMKAQLMAAATGQAPMEPPAEGTPQAAAEAEESEPAVA
jgi:hypothetical protein